MKRIALFSVFALIIAGCQEQIGPDVEGPDFARSDGTEVGGNPDFFFLPPIVADPSNHPNFDPGEFNPDLAPTAVLCDIDVQWVTINPGFLPELDPNTPDGLAACGNVEPGKPQVFNLASTTPGGVNTLFLDAANERYGLNWDRSGENFDPIWRFTILVGSLELGYLDFVIRGGQFNVKALDTDEFVALNFLNELPLRFRIENGALCPPTATDCASKTIDFDQGGTIALDDGDNVDIPSQGQQTGIVSTITVTPCANGSIPVDLPKFGDCLEITADPPLANALPVPAVVSICSLDPLADLPAWVTPDQEEQITLHRVDNGTVEALPHALDNCDEVLGSALPKEDLFMRLARSGYGTVRDVLGLPKPLNASRVMLRRRLDRGRGGASPFFSDFQFALPGKMDEVPATDGQQAPAGQNVPLPPTVRITDLFFQPVPDVEVTFVVTSGGGQIGSTQVTVMTDGDGLAAPAFWTLGPTPGTNTVEARVDGAAIEGVDGPRQGFDPFIPLNVEFDGVDGPPITVLNGVIVFTATGTSN